MKKIFLSPPHIGKEELKFVEEAFESNYVAPFGPQIDEFEREFSEYVGIPHAVAVSSGTAAMHLAMRLLDVMPKDEVIASTLTFIGSISPAVFQGAELTFVDCDRVSWNMDPDLLKEALENCRKRGKLPKAVVTTDLYGQCMNYNKIIEICRMYRVPLVADAAEAMGAKYKKVEHKMQDAEKTEDVHAGVGAKAAVFSFNGNKIITTSGGGMLASEDKKFVKKARYLSQQARESFPHYEHTEIGYNYRMSNILAAIGRGQLRIINERVERKREIFDYYLKFLGDIPGIEFMPEVSYGRCNRWLTVILITPEKFGADRETVRLALEAKNIEARPVWKPMHLQPVFRVKGRSLGRISREGDCKRRMRVIGGGVAEDLFNRGLCLPSGTEMLYEDLDKVIEIILKCHRNGA